MTDLEITKRCAEAMGLDIFKVGGMDQQCSGNGWYCVDDSERGFFPFCPLQNDEQAMALLKKFRIAIGRNKDKVRARFTSTVRSDWRTRDDLNRAICECVARLQEVKQHGE